MPVYPFKCDACGAYVEDVRHMSESDKQQMCECGAKMRRVYLKTQVSVPNNSGYHNYGLGIDVHHKNDVKDYCKRHFDTTGSEIVEVGNENLKKHVKPVRQEYTIPAYATEKWGVD